MKKIMNASLIYFVWAMVGGVFYREFTKWNGYTEPTTLGVLHVHLLLLGTFVFFVDRDQKRNDPEIVENRKNSKNSKNSKNPLTIG